MHGGTSAGAVVLGPTAGRRPRAGTAHGSVSDLRANGLRDAVALGEPTIPPMALSPCTNMPDFAVTEPRFAAEGYGGLPGVPRSGVGPCRIIS